VAVLFYTKVGKYSPAQLVSRAFQKKVRSETGLLVCAKTNCRRHSLQRVSARSHRPGLAYPGPVYPDLALPDQDLPARDFLGPVYPDPGFPDRGYLDRDHIVHLGRDCPDHIAVRYSSRDLSIISTTPNAPSVGPTGSTRLRSRPALTTRLLFAERNKRDKKRVPCGCIPPPPSPIRGSTGLLRREGRTAEASVRSCHLYQTEQSRDVQPAKFLDHRHFSHPGAGDGESMSVCAPAWEREAAMGSFKRPRAL
jgi:hypothetical protein